MLLLKLALRPWRLAPYSQFFSAFAVAFLLLLAGLLFWMQQGLKPVLVRLQQEQVITAYLGPSIDPKSDNQVIDQIQLALERIRRARMFGLFRPTSLRRTSRRVIPISVTSLRSSVPNGGHRTEIRFDFRTFGRHLARNGPERCLASSQPRVPVIATALFLAPSRRFAGWPRFFPSVYVLRF